MYKVSWAEAGAMCEALATSIDERFDVIVCVLRGGAVPGAVLANELSIETVVSMRVVQRGQLTKDETENRAYVSQPGLVHVPLNNVDLTGRRVLIVEDVIDSGATVERVLVEVQARGASYSAVASLHVKPYATVRPKYFVEERAEWIFYPWMSQSEYRAMEDRH